MIQVKRYAPLAVLVLVAAAVLFSGVGDYLRLDALSANEAALRAFVEERLILALVVFIAVYALATAISIPGGLILTLAGGFLFGTWLGGAATVIGATIGAVAVFYAVRTSFGESLRRRAEASGGRLKTIIDGVAAGAFGYILTLRLIPVMPFWFVNVAAGLAHAPTGAYTLATLIGILPATFIYSGIGAGIGELVARGEAPDLQAVLAPQVLLPLVALGLLTLATTIYRQRRRKAGAQT
jgi:uncharacterized membrane protein YdjX (TVP38/TMEM64 family)